MLTSNQITQLDRITSTIDRSIAELSTMYEGLKSEDHEQLNNIVNQHNPFPSFDELSISVNIWRKDVKAKIDWIREVSSNM